MWRMRRKRRDGLEQREGLWYCSAGEQGRALATGSGRRGGGCAGRRSDVICLRLGRALLLPDFNLRLH